MLSPKIRYTVTEDDARSGPPAPHTGTLWAHTRWAGGEGREGETETEAEALREAQHHISIGKCESKPQ